MMGWAKRHINTTLIVIRSASSKSVRLNMHAPTSFLNKLMLTDFRRCDNFFKAVFIFNNIHHKVRCSVTEEIRHQMKLAKIDNQEKLNLP